MKKFLIILVISFFMVSCDSGSSGNSGYSGGGSNPSFTGSGSTVSYRLATAYYEDGSPAFTVKVFDNYVELPSDYGSHHLQFYKASYGKYHTYFFSMGTFFCYFD